jgi:hypothetical protein
LDTFTDVEENQEDKYQNLYIENKAANLLHNRNSADEEITILTEEAIVVAIGTIADNILEMKEDNLKPLPPADSMNMKLTRKEDSASSD